MTTEPSVAKDTSLDRYFRPSEAARYIGISESTLAKLRMRNSRFSGPNWVKAAGCVIYRKSDLDTWLEENLVEAVAGPQH